MRRIDARHGARCRSRHRLQRSIRAEYGPGVDMRVDTPRTNLDDPGIGLRDNGRRVLTYADVHTIGAADHRADTGREIELHLTGHMERYIWSFNGQKFSDAEPLRLAHGERVRIVLVNDTMMTHPIHLHGMWSELETPDGEFLARKHTVVVQPAQKISYRVSADALGRWAYHCHLLYHMEAGMFREVRGRMNACTTARSAVRRVALGIVLVFVVIAPVAAQDVAIDPSQDGTAGVVGAAPVIASEHADHEAPQQRARNSDATSGHVAPSPPQHPMQAMNARQMTDTMEMDDAATFAMLRLDRFERADTDDGIATAWKLSAWLGGDFDKLWLRSEGEHAHGETGEPTRKSSGTMRAPRSGTRNSACARISAAARIDLGRIRRAGPRAVLVRDRRDRLCRRWRTHARCGSRLITTLADAATDPAAAIEFNAYGKRRSRAPESARDCPMPRSACGCATRFGANSRRMSASNMITSVRRARLISRARMAAGAGDTQWVVGLRVWY